MRSLANLVIILFTTSPINHRISKSGFCQSVNQSIKLPPVNEFLIWVLGAIYVNFGPMGWGEGSFKDDAMCTQLTVDGETAWGHASSYRGDWQQQQQQHTKIIREIEKTYVRKKLWTKRTKTKHEQNEVMKGNPHPVVESKSRNRSRVNSRLQVWATGQQPSLYWWKRTTNTNRKAW